KVKKRVELESQTEFIKLKAATGIVLEVGASRIEMEANGKITIQGLHVDVIGTSRIDLNTNAKSNSSPVSNDSNSKLSGAEKGIVPTQTAGHANRINHGALVNGKSPPKEVKAGQMNKPANDNKSGTGEQKQNRRVNPALEQRWKQAKPNIVAAANAADVDAGVLAKIAAFESGFDPNARPISKNAKMNVVRQFDGTLAISSAHGYGQFTDATWTASMRKHGEKYGVSNASQLSKNEAAAYRKDVRLQAAMLAELTKENIILGRKFGGESDDANVYALHNLGTGDGQKFLRALQINPDKPVNSVLSVNVIGGNPSLYGNGNISIADAYKRMDSVMGANNVFADDARK
uniref:hypothetical protein n=1 Tax=Noviherbaspirillum malthae TaxID=1260987 RepID=UPI001E36014C